MKLVASRDTGEHIPIAIPRSWPGATRPQRTELERRVKVRELDTPYRPSAAPASVATPSCCCCCCCLTALIVPPVYAGFSTARRARRHGRDGVWPGLLTAFAGPVGLSLTMLSDAVPPSAEWTILVMVTVVAVSGIVAGRRLAGDGWGSAITWGVIGVIAWAAALTADFFAGFWLLLYTAGIGILIEWALIPLWIWLIVRSHKSPPPTPASGPYGPLPPYGAAPPYGTAPPYGAAPPYGDAPPHRAVPPPPPGPGAGPGVGGDAPPPPYSTHDPWQGPGAQ